MGNEKFASVGYPRVFLMPSENPFCLIFYEKTVHDNTFCSFRILKNSPVLSFKTVLKRLCQPLFGTGTLKTHQIKPKNSGTVWLKVQHYSDA